MGASAFDPRDRSDARQFPKSLIGGKWQYHQPWLGDRLRYMARSGGYVMVRKPRAVPFVMSEKDWAKLPVWGTLSSDPQPLGSAREATEDGQHKTNPDPTVRHGRDSQGGER